ncbi:MAG TPA: FtsH protease activity modulator HflK [Candidatus Sulfotelmatobacter sp.]|nr:FtsH protease activity modulator HflK [Candidatus Sulfotelmatobacter sp.]
MPWGNQGGGWQGGGGRGPWGQGPRGGGGGPQPPNLEELLRRGQDRFRSLMPGGFKGGRGVTLVIAVLFAIWMASGFYKVQPDEEGVVLRFGAWIKTTQPGLNYHLPYPIEMVLKPKVTRVNTTEIGFRTSDTGGRDVPAESLMLTGDENIVDIDFSVQWLIKDAGQMLFNIKDPSPYAFDIEGPQQTVKDVAESAMREVIARSPIQRIMTDDRGSLQGIQADVQKLMQEMLDSYKSGIEITQVNLQKAAAPTKEVIAAFNDVQAALTDRGRMQNEAEAYSNDIIPRARGDAEKIIQGAQAYKQQVIAEAQGEAARFLSNLNAYKQAKDVTARRLYLETMEQVFKGMNKVIVDEPPGSPGVLPYLPLPDLRKKPTGGGQ